MKSLQFGSVESVFRSDPSGLAPNCLSYAGDVVKSVKYVN